MRTTVAGGALLLLVATGCADPASTPTADSTQAINTTETIDASPLPSPSASAGSPPEVDLTAEDGDYQRVVEEILRFREWLFAHPHRQDLISVIYNQDCPCVATLTTRLDEYVDSGVHAEVDFELGKFELLERDELTARIRVTFRGTGRVLDHSGTVLDEGTSPEISEEWLLLRDPTGHHRVADQIELAS